jgi:triphosphatase
LARKALTKTWKRVRKRGRGIESLNAEQRHELRKALKKLRYTVEFFSSLYPAKEAERFGKRLKKLQKLCGDVSDAAMVAATFSEKGMLSDTDPKSQRAIGCMIGANKVRAEFVWRESSDHWRRLKKIQLFWK